MVIWPIKIRVLEPLQQTHKEHGRKKANWLGRGWVGRMFLDIFCGWLALLTLVNNLLDCLSACPNFLLSALAGRGTFPEDSRLKSIATGFKSI